MRKKPTRNIRLNLYCPYFFFLMSMNVTVMV